LGRLHFVGHTEITCISHRQHVGTLHVKMIVIVAFTQVPSDSATYIYK